MSRLPRSPLLLAVVVALVPITVLAVALGLHGRPRQPVATPTPSPSATARSARLPQLVVADDATLGAPRAFGPLDVTGIDHHADLPIARYTFAAGAPSLPDTAPVWNLRGFANLPTTALEARLGVSPPTPEFPGDKFDGLIDISQGRVSVASGTQAASLNAGARVTDDASAVTAVTQLLDGLGLMPQSATATAAVSEPLPVTTWRVTFMRRPIEAIPVGFAGSDAAAQVDITALGAITRLVVDAPSLAGGSRYPLRGVQDAWQEVSRGHWFDECCDVFTGAAPGPTPIAFRADSVSLVEYQLDAPQMRLVPVYVFTDSAAQLSLAIPALQARDLSEPGGFRLVQPGEG